MAGITEEQIAALQDSKLSRDTPYVIRNVSHTQFSVARYSGGCVFNGKRYSYNPAADELVRDDVLKFLKKSDKQVEPEPVLLPEIEQTPALDD